MTYRRVEVREGDQVGFWVVVKVKEIHEQYGRICEYKCDICGAETEYYLAQMKQKNSKRHSCKRCRRVAAMMFGDLT